LLTLPKIYLKNVKVEQGKLNQIDVPAPGRLNISYGSTGVGSLYEINNVDKQKLIKRLGQKNGRASFAIQPGTYKLVFRSNKALGSKYTQIKEFRIKSGATQTIRIY